MDMCDSPPSASTSRAPSASPAQATCQIDRLLRELRPELARAVEVACTSPAVLELLCGVRRGFPLCARCAETVYALLRLRWR